MAPAGVVAIRFLSACSPVGSLRDSPRKAVKRSETPTADDYFKTAKRRWRFGGVSFS